LGFAAGMVVLSFRLFLAFAFWVFIAFPARCIKKKKIKKKEKFKGVLFYSHSHAGGSLMRPR
jgi:hypothetical protein